MIQNNLPPESQQWARDIESRVVKTEISLSNNSASDSATRALLGSAQVTLGDLSKRATATTVQSRPSVSVSEFTIPAPALSHSVLVDSFKITVPPYASTWVTLKGRVYQYITGYSGPLNSPFSVGLKSKISTADDMYYSYVTATGTSSYIGATANANPALTYNTGAVNVFTRERRGDLYAESEPVAYTYNVYMDVYSMGSGTTKAFGEVSVTFETYYNQPGSFTILD